LLNHLETLTTNQLVQTLPTAAQDNLLVSFLEQKNMVDQRVVSIGRDFGSNNPTLVKALALQAELQHEIDERVQGIMDTLNVKVDALRKALTNLDQRVETAKAADLKEGTASLPYFDAKRLLEELIRFRTLLENKIAAESLQNPGTLAVEIIDLAAPPPRAIAPNRFLAAALIGSGLLLDLLGALMLRAGRRPALPPAS
jgi:uncharacterized protein involved in exopolysaccharide biosynthesis